MNAALDDNGKPTLIGILDSDGVTITQVQADPTTHGLAVDDGTSGTDEGNNEGNAQLDDNGKPVLTALSSADDGTIVEVYVTSDGKLKVDSA